MSCSTGRLRPVKGCRTRRPRRCWGGGAMSPSGHAHPEPHPPHSGHAPQHQSPPPQIPTAPPSGQRPALPVQAPPQPHPSSKLRPPKPHPPGSGGRRGARPRPRPPASSRGASWPPAAPALDTRQGGDTSGTHGDTHPRVRARRESGERAEDAQGPARRWDGRGRGDTGGRTGVPRATHRPHPPRGKRR